MNTYALTPDHDGSTKVTIVPSNQWRVALQVVPPLDLRRDQPAYKPPEVVTIDVQRFGRSRALLRRERRRLARARGRRRAVSIPWLMIWEARVAVHPAIPPGEVERFATEHAEIVQREFTKPRR